MNHPCPECASCITPDRRYDPTNCVPCLAFLANMKINNDPASSARRSWTKWNRTLVNKWKKNGVALYTPKQVRMILWADQTLHEDHAPYLPVPAPARSSSRSSRTSAEDNQTIPPDLDILGPERSSPWSEFGDEPEEMEESAQRQWPDN